MNELMKNLKNLVKNEDGQTMAEYGIILFVIALVAIVGATLLGTDLRDLFNNVAGAI
ncbi:MAG: Flp family type IVb pilin [Gaiellaceae bacterium]